MMTSVSTRSPGTLNPTRQQLDELDALLQRMLELPVNKLDDPEQEAAEEPADELPVNKLDDTEQEAAEELADEPPPPVQPTSPPPPDTLPAPQVERGHEVKQTRPAAPMVSYMVVETASPRPLPPASGFEPQPSTRTLRLVPVAPPEVRNGETPVSPQQKTSETPVPPVQQTTSEMPVPTLSEIPVPTGQEELWVPLRSTWQPSAQTWQPLAESWHQANNGLPMPEAVPSPLPSPRLELPSPLGDASRASPEVGLGSPDLPTPEDQLDSPELPPPTTPEPQLSLSAEDAPVETPPLLLPLLWFNQGFDACLAPLGAPGRWLCGSHGRLALGLVGLTCLAAAAAIAVSAGMGWTW
jgi:hypothetical protein